MDRDSFPITPRLVLGALVVLYGSLLLLDNLRILDADRLLDYWPAILIAIGVTVFVRARGLPGHVAALAWIAGGTLLLLDSLHILSVDIGELWPAALVLFGGYLIWQSMTGGGARPAAAAAPSDGTASISTLAFMSGLNRKSNSPDFRGGEVTAIMGGCELDLTQASIASGEAVLDTFVWWGGIDIRVPEDWTVVGKVFPLMGGFEDKTRPPKTADKRFVIRGLVVMGGIEIKN
jgi:predicted membrane protein